jgi:tRNA-2-methylthio-N6-dimethylallyladenosine synthase
LVHLAVPAGSERPRPGDLVTTSITSAAAFHLIADHDAPLVIRRTRAGDAWDRAEAASCGTPVTGRSATNTSAGDRVGLGLPTVRAQGGAQG